MPIIDVSWMAAYRNELLLLAHLSYIVLFLIAFGYIFKAIHQVWDDSSGKKYDRLTKN